MDLPLQLVLRGVGAVYNSAELRTRISPSASFSIEDLTSDGPPNPLIQWLQPTLTLTAPDGKRSVVAPYGVAAGDGTANAIGVVLVIFAAGFAAGTLVSKFR